MEKKTKHLNNSLYMNREKHRKVLIEVGEHTKRDVKEGSPTRGLSDSLILSALSKEDCASLLGMISNHLKKNHHLTQQEINELSDDLGEYSIPLQIFSTKLSPAESLVKYLKEEKNLAFHEIADLLNRDNRSIWGTYNRAKKKMSEKFTVKDELMLPIAIFKDRSLSIFECFVLYLKEKHKLSNKRISELINKRSSTIATVYHRVRKKKRI
jgi:hypothetical protein